jgi:hypothetical protein
VFNIAHEIKAAWQPDFLAKTYVYPGRRYRVYCIERTRFSSYALVFSMNPKRTSQVVEDHSLSIEEVRIVSDLRIMHAKVDELRQLVSALKKRHNESDVVKYADQPILTEDIQNVDEIYRWFVKLKEEAIAQRRGSG